jgi:hypothetical protein
VAGVGAAQEASDKVLFAGGAAEVSPRVHVFAGEGESEARAKDYCMRRHRMNMRRIVDWLYGLYLSKTGTLLHCGVRGKALNKNARATELK